MAPNWKAMPASAPPHTKVRSISRVGLGRSSRFQINNGGTLPQSILGLPLFNNYYTVFDRTQDPYGAVRFAPIAPAAAMRN